MAFASKVGNLLKRTVTSNPSLYQAIRCMSTSKLFVGGISYGTDDQSLREAFANYGEVVEARVIIDRESGRSRGFGFITFTSSEEASAAITAMDGKDLHGRMIRVNYANDRTGGFRGYGGGGGYGAGGGYAGSGSFGGYTGNAGDYGGGDGGGGNYGGGYNAGDNYNSSGSGGGNYGGSHNVGDNYNSGGGSGGGYGGGNVGGDYNVAGGGGGGSDNYMSGASSGANNAASPRGGGDYGAMGYGGNSDQYGSSGGGGGRYNSQDDLPEDKFNDDDLDDEPEDYANKRG